MTAQALCVLSKRTVEFIPVSEGGLLAGLAEGRVNRCMNRPREDRIDPRNVPDIGYTATETCPSDSCTRSRRAQRAQTRASERWPSPQRGRPPRRVRARAPLRAICAWRGRLLRRAGRADEGEGRTPTPPPLVVEVGETHLWWRRRRRRCAQASRTRTRGLGEDDVWRVARLQEALRPSERTSERARDGNARRDGQRK
jgi:hypothetical protein